MWREVSWRPKQMAAPLEYVEHAANAQRFFALMSNGNVSGGPFRLLCLVTDAFGGRGGIAKVNRDLLASLCELDGPTEITAVPRVVLDEPGAMPVGLRYRAEYAHGKRAYVRGVLATAGAGRLDGVVCGHLHLLPLAWYVARRHRVPLLLIVHGIEAWRRPRNPFTRFVAGRVDAVVAVSDFTRRRFLAWSRLPADRARVIPNSVDVARFLPGGKSETLLRRYGLEGRTVLLTVGRLAGAERSKGFDEIIELLPKLARRIPGLSYLVVGEGLDQRRLEEKAARLGVADRVVFAGYVDEREKAEHYRLADAFVMPSRGEGFGIVHLEALACGIPVIASSADGSSEAVLGGEMGEVVDPADPAQLEAAILRALGRGRVVPEGLRHFHYDAFRSRWHRTIREVFPG